MHYNCCVSFPLQVVLAAVAFTPTFTFVAAKLLSLVYKPDLCLSLTSDTQCHLSLSLGEGLPVGISLVVFLLCWFWSYVTLTLTHIGVSHDSFRSELFSHLQVFMFF